MNSPNTAHVEPGETPRNGEDRCINSLLRVLTVDPDGDTLCQSLTYGALADHRPLGITLMLCSEPTRTLVDIGRYGWTHTTTHMLSTMPYDAATIGAHSRRSCEAQAVPFDHIATTYPALALIQRETAEQLPHDELEHAEIAAFPLLHSGVVTGVLTALVRTPFNRGVNNHPLLLGVSDALALWAHIQLLKNGRPLPRSHPTETRGRRGTDPTARQLRIVHLLRDGLTNAQIARELGYSESTVKQDIATMTRRLGATSRADLIERASLAGW